VFSVLFLLACQTVPEFRAANLAYEQPAEQWAGNAQKPVAALQLAKRFQISPALFFG